MNIRSITIFTDPDSDPIPVRRFIKAAKERFEIPIQTVRLAFGPFPTWCKRKSILSEVEETIDKWQDIEADYFSLGPVQLRHDSDWLFPIPELLGRFENVFVAAEIADLAGMIDPQRCVDTARTIIELSRIRKDGFANLFFGALANCPPGGPYFPVAYHDSGPTHFALAVESADLAVSAFQSADSLGQARQNLVSRIESAATFLASTSRALEKDYPLRFTGIDFSLAPYPDQQKSLARALELLGLDHFGAPGTLFASAFVTDAVSRADYPRTGFSGLMLPLLEDTVVAARASAGLLSVNELLTYSAVCGVGLDTVPLPGDTDSGTIAGILLDLAALATRLDKPLIARLMPVPGLSAGDTVDYEFFYFARGSVLPIADYPVEGMISSSQRFDMRSL